MLKNEVDREEFSKEFERQVKNEFLHIVAKYRKTSGKILDPAEAVTLMEMFLTGAWVGLSVGQKVTLALMKRRAKND